MKEKSSMKKTIILAFFSILICILSLATATYAWFTQNKTVESDKITTMTAEEDLFLYVSEKGGSDFEEKEESQIVQVNKYDAENLFPVSTDDLVHFVNQESTESGIGYSLVEDEALYYHGQIYLKAKSIGNTINKVALFLDDIDNLFVSDDKKDSDRIVLNAVRVGLKIDDQIVIIQPTAKNNDEKDQVYNTVVDGEIAGDNVILHWNGTKAELTSDISKYAGEFFVDSPYSSPFAIIKTNEIYLMDVFIYLEGCDPDCSSSIQAGGANLHLALFAVPEV